MLRHDRHVRSLMLAADASQRLRSALEIGICALLIIGITAFASRQYPQFIGRSQAAEALTLSTTVRFDMMEYRAERGEWPTDAGQVMTALPREEDSLGVYVSHFAPGNRGEITATFTEDGSTAGLAGRQLTIRPATRAATPGAPVSWICGRRPVAAELELQGVDRTNVDARYLPIQCKEF